MVLEETPSGPLDGSPDTSLLVVEDDFAYRQRLETAMARRGYQTNCAGSIEEAQQCIDACAPRYAVIDLKLQDGSGLDVVDALRKARPDARSIILTGYADIPTAVCAVRSGASDYLTKPTTAEEIDTALRVPSGAKPPAPAHPTPPNEVKRLHIRRVLEMCRGNVSETARRLNMHRRTLQRILLRDRTV